MSLADQGIYKLGFFVMTLVIKAHFLFKLSFISLSNASTFHGI